jgi:hypothetical protein
MKSLTVQLLTETWPLRRYSALKIAQARCQNCHFVNRQTLTNVLPLLFQFKRLSHSSIICIYHQLLGVFDQDRPSVSSSFRLLLANKLSPG